MNSDNYDIDLHACTEAKTNCRLVYRTALGKAVSVQGIIRDVFLLPNSTEKIAVLENGLPIPTRNILHIQRMEG